MKKSFVNSIHIQKNVVIVELIIVTIVWKSVLEPVVTNIVDFVGSGRKEVKYVILAIVLFAISAILFTKNVSMNHVWLFNAENAHRINSKNAQSVMVNIVRGIIPI